MADSGELLIVIPARGGSKRLPRKNVLPLAGKPLICWTIESALKTSLKAKVIVTSDDEEILAVSGRYADQGVILHKRPDTLATDTASTVDAVIDAIKTAEVKGTCPDTVILLQPTSPLREASDIEAAVGLYRKSDNQNSVVSVCEVEHPTAWTGHIADNDILEGVDFSGRRSQDFKTEYRLNGAVYVASKDYVTKHRTLFTKVVKASLMPKCRSVDIDNEDDFILCQYLIEHRKSN